MKQKGIVWQVKANYKYCNFIYSLILFLPVCTAYDQTVTATSLSRYLQSPNYPSNYNTGTTCQWKIQTQSDSYFVKLEFTHFNLQYTSSCSSGDYVEVRDGASQSSGLIKKYCYQDKPSIFAKIYSSGRYIHVRFRSDYFTSISSGFRIKYSAVYRGELLPFSNTL